MSKMAEVTVSAIDSASLHTVTVHVESLAASSQDIGRTLLDAYVRAQHRRGVLHLDFHGVDSLPSSTIDSLSHLLSVRELFSADVRLVNVSSALQAMLPAEVIRAVQQVRH